jgi:Intracellular proteinase inhibitor
MRATIQTDRSRVRAGETVRLTYTISNGGTQPATFSFSSGQQCDMEVRRRPEPNARYQAGALTLWQLSRGRFYTEALTRLVLAPGEKKVFTEVWVVPKTLPVGVYELIGYLTPMGGGGATQAVATLTVIS